MKLRWSKSSSLLQRVAFLVYKFNHSFQGKVNQFCVGSHGIIGNSLCTKSKNISHYFDLHDSLTMHTLLYGSTLFVGSDTVRQKIFENTFFYRICPDDTSKYFVKVLKVMNRNTRERCKICLKLTIKNHTSHLFLCFYC